MILGFVLGVASGLISSWLIWLYLTHILTPKIVFGSGIARVVAEDGSVRYLFAYRNVGERRVIDLQIKVSVSIKGIVTWSPELWQTYYLVPSSNQRPNLEHQKTITSRICLADSTELQHSFIPDDLRRKLLEGQPVLEDLLALGHDAHLKVFIFGYDEFSGARKLFDSPSYTLSSIQEGLFNRNTLFIENRVAMGS